MHLSWFGLSAFKIETKSAVLVTDPFAPGVTSRPLRAKADIVTVSHSESEAHNHVAALSGEPFVIDSPGEFEVKGIYVQGIGSGSRQEAVGSTTTTLFTFDCEGLRLAHLGGIRSVPQGDTLEKIDGVDVLFLPVGGGPTLDPDVAMRVVNAIEPRVVVPMHFFFEGLKLQSKLLSASAFLREIGASKVEPVERASLKKRDLNEEETTVLLLKSVR